MAQTAAWNNGTSGSHSAPKITARCGPNDSFSEASIKISLIGISVAYPILLLCCTVGNLLCLIVLHRKRRMTCTRIYMTIVSLSSLMILWQYLPVYLWNLDIRIRKAQSFQTGFYRFRGVNIWLSETSIQLCDWTLVLFSMERFLAILKPLRCSSLDQVSTLPWKIGIIACYSGTFALFHIVSYYSYDYYINLHFGPQKPSRRPQWLLQWRALQGQAEIVVTNVKFAILLTVNMSCAFILYRQQNNNLGRPTPSSSSSARTRRRSFNSHGILITSVAVYIVAHLPSQVVNIVYLFADEFRFYEVDNCIRRFIAPFNNFMFLFNYCANFFLYTVVSRTSRAELRRVIGPKCPRSASQRRLIQKFSGYESDNKEAHAVPMEMQLYRRRSVPVEERPSDPL